MKFAIKAMGEFGTESFIRIVAGSYQDPDFTLCLGF